MIFESLFCCGVEDGIVYSLDMNIFFNCWITDEANCSDGSESKRVGFAENTIRNKLTNSLN